MQKSVESDQEIFIQNKNNFLLPDPDPDPCSFDIEFCC